MKTATHHLHSLIHSLSSEEKRHFKIFASHHIFGGGNKYTRLFDTIQSQKIYNEAALKLKFGHNPGSSKFKVMKIYLTEIVLKSLGFFHSEKTVRNVLSLQLQKIEVLFNKAQYELCGKLISKALILAQIHEYFLIQIDILQWKIRLLQTKSASGVQKGELSEASLKLKDALSKEENLLLCQGFWNVLNMKISEKGWQWRNGSEIENEYKPLITHEVFTTESCTLSIKAKILRSVTLSAYHYLAGDLKSHKKENMILFRIFTAHPQMKISEMEYYILCLDNIVYNFLRRGVYREVDRCIALFNTLQPQSVFLNCKIAVSTHLPRLIILNSSKQTKAAIDLIPDIAKLLHKFKSSISKRDVLYFYYNFSCAYFKAGKYKESLVCLSEILNDPEAMMLPDISANTRLLNLLVHYELGNFDLLPYLLRSTFRFLMQNNRMYQFEKIALTFIRKLTEVPVSSVSHLLTDLHKELMSLANANSYEKYAMEYCGFMEWLSGKIKQ